MAFDLCVDDQPEIEPMNASTAKRNFETLIIALGILMAVIAAVST